MSITYDSIKIGAIYCCAAYYEFTIVRKVREISADVASLDVLVNFKDFYVDRPMNLHINYNSIKLLKPAKITNVSEICELMNSMT